MLLKFKDYITTGNIICGFISVVFLLMDQFFYASLFVVLAILFDLADGYVARTWATANRFGAEFDNLADHISYAVAPYFLVYYAIAPINNIVAAILGALIITTGTIRLARFNVKRCEIPGYFIGFPRPASAILLVSFLNSHIFAAYTSLYIIAPLVFLLAMMNVTLVPYIGHHKRKFNMVVKIAGVLFILLMAYAINTGFIWDLIFIACTIYLLSPAFSISFKEHKRISAELKKIWS